MFIASCDWCGLHLKNPEDLHVLHPQFQSEGMRDLCKSCLDKANVYVTNAGIKHDKYMTALNEERKKAMAVDIKAWVIVEKEKQGKLRDHNYKHDLKKKKK